MRDVQHLSEEESALMLWVDQSWIALVLVFSPDSLQDEQLCRWPTTSREELLSLTTVVAVSGRHAKNALQWPHTNPRMFVPDIVRRGHQLLVCIHPSRRR